MIDLKKLKDIVYSNPEPVLDRLGIEYEIFGDNIYSTCPIHDGSDNPRAFSLSSKMKMWKCWTHNCHEEHRDIFGLVSGTLGKKRGTEVSFGQALHFLCETYKVDGESADMSAEEVFEESPLTKMVKIFQAPNSITNAAVEITQVKDEVSEYFINRGFSKETLEHFDIKECTQRSDELRHRIVIPIHDTVGALVGYIYRANKRYIEPKYLFSSGFKKANYLYNYHRAIESAQKSSCLFIVEGQGDVWKLYEAGVHNCVGLFGLCISKTQREQLMNSGVTTLIILTDNDQSGRESKIAIQRDMSRYFTVQFPQLIKKDIGEMNVDALQNQILSQIKGTY